MAGFRIGDFEVFEIVEGAMDPPAQEFFPRAEPEEIADLAPTLDPRLFGANGAARLVFRCYVLRTPRSTIMVDTCIGNDKPRERASVSMLKTPFLADLRKLGVEPESVDYVFCTHMHFDHVGWHTRLENGAWVPTFPNAKHVFRQKEYDYWTSDAGMKWGRDVMEDSVVPVVDAGLAEIVSDDDYAIEDGVWVEPLEGHTPGHAGLHVKSNGAEAVFTGDMLHHVLQVAQPSWEIAVTVNKKLAEETRRAFLEQYADTDTRIVPTHFTIAEGGRVVGKNGRFGYEPLA